MVSEWCRSVRLNTFIHRYFLAPIFLPTTFGLFRAFALKVGLHRCEEFSPDRMGPITGF